MGNTDSQKKFKDTGADSLQRGTDAGSLRPEKGSASRDIHKKGSASRNIKVRVVCIFILLTLAFIWGHSMVPADLSTEESSYFVNLINGFLSSLGVGISVTDHIVRKTAHFMEYTLLGGEVSLLSIYMGAEKKRKTVSTDTLFAKIPVVYIFWVGAPLIDEFIQYFTPGRACMWQDVLLDMAGFAAGFLFLRGCAVLWDGKWR